MEKWAKLTSDDLYHQLKAVCANELSVYAAPILHSQDTGIRANKMLSKPKNSDRDKEKTKSPGLCFKFSKGQPCAISPCPYSHDAPPARQSRPQEQKSNAKCTKCSGAHFVRQCTYNGICGLCKKVGHMDSKCHEKSKANNASISEGGQLRANMVYVQIVRRRSLTGRALPS